VPKLSADEPGRLDRNRATVERFAIACGADPAVLGAFLGGSLAAETADEESDLDLYVVVDAPSYEQFLARRERFLRAWADPVFSAEIRNFENLGFDMIVFTMADGVEGELALATPQNFLTTHGGPHRVLVDKAGLLSGVEFPLLSFDERPGKEEVERTLWSFWWQVRGAVKARARRRWWEAASQLKDARDSCLVLASAAGADDPREALAPTFASLDPEALAEGILTAVRCYLEWGPPAAESVGASYPEGLARVSTDRVASSLGSPTGEPPDPKAS
jgi:nucleotidyltransferase-like protein